MKHTLLSLAIVLTALPSLSGWPAVDGQLVDAFGDPNLSDDVRFRVEVFSEGATCLLSSEVFDNSGAGYNLSQTRGSFSLGLSLGAAQNFPGANANYGDVFATDPSGARNTCTDPIVVGENREFLVSYSIDSGVSWNTISTPIIYSGAASASTLNGLGEANFVATNTSTTQANLDALTSLLYPGGAPTGGDVLTTDGAGGFTLSTPTGGAGTVTSVVAGTGLAGGTITTTGTIALSPSGVGAGGVIGSTTQAAQFTVDTYGRITAASTNPIDPGLQTLSGAEIDQLEEIDSHTIDNTKWGYLAGMTGPPLDSSTDTLGNHMASQNLKLNGFSLNNNGTGGLSIDNSGNAAFSLNVSLAGDLSSAGNIDASDVTATNQFLAADGNSTNAGFAFDSANNTGIHRSGGGDMVFSVGGNDDLKLSGNGGITMEQNVGSPSPGDCNSLTVGLVKHFALGSYHCFDDAGTARWVPLGAGPAKCPGGYSMVGEPGQSSSFCIRDTIRAESIGAVAYVNALNFCSGDVASFPRGRPTICNTQQLVRACLDGHATGTGITDSGNFSGASRVANINFQAGPICTSSGETVYTSSASNYYCCID